MPTVSLGQLRLYALGLSSSAKKGASDCSALADYATAAGAGRTARQLNETLGIFVQQDLRSTFPGIPANASPVYITSPQRGFLPQYQNSGSDTSNQTHHFAAFFSLGFQQGLNQAAAFGNVFEAVEAVLHPSGGFNQGDVNLAVAAASLGSQLAQGIIMPEDLGQIIQDVVCKR